MSRCEKEVAGFIQVTATSTFHPCAAGATTKRTSTTGCFTRVTRHLGPTYRLLTCKKPLPPYKLLMRFKQPFLLTQEPWAHRTEASWFSKLPVQSKQVSKSSKFLDVKNGGLIFAILAHLRWQGRAGQRSLPIRQKAWILLFVLVPNDRRFGGISENLLLL